MSQPASIFDEVRINAKQAREVGRRRFADARKLADSGKTRHANGAMYLAGYAVECSLKACVLDRYPEVRRFDTKQQSKRVDHLRSLVYQRHDLGALLNVLPDVTRRMEEAVHARGPAQLVKLQNICSNWSVRARYSPRQATIEQAIEFLAMVEDVLEWLE